ncbi:MAG: carbon-nitrogen hydrolase family protein [FCB group bacterium]|nr:carbon-nitrogen hydrolase family protein [FCB group bacterium]
MAKMARIAAIMYKGSSVQEKHAEANVREVGALIDRAMPEQPDLIVLPETFNSLGFGGDAVKAAEPSDGPTLTAMAAKAAEHKVWIVSPIYEWRDGAIYNSAILLNREGRIAGTYHKMYPTVGEMDAGVRPGQETVVVDTDFGKVGMAICFDLNFRPVGEGNREQGAKLLAFSSMYRGGLSAQIWAYDFGFYLVSATPDEMSHFCTPVGRVLADSWHYQPIVTREVNLDYEVLHIDFNYSRWEDIRKKYGKLVEMDIYGPEGIFMLTSKHPEMSVADIMREFDLESRKDYFARSIRRREETLRPQQVKS